MSECSQNHGKDTRAANETPFDGLSVTGFTAVCAWHFLIVFSAVPSTGAEALEGRAMIIQFTLYLSLACSYALLMYVSKPLTRLLYRHGTSSWQVANIGLGIAASLITLIVCMQGGSFAFGIISWALLGLSEALLMFPWLQLPSICAGKLATPRNLAFNMGLGGAAAFIIGNFTAPLNFTLLVLLPLCANLSLARIWSHADEAMMSRKEELAEIRHAPQLPTRLLENSHFLFYGLAFGVCQSAISFAQGDAGTASYAVSSCWPICGVIIASLIVMLIPREQTGKQGLFTIQHLSALIFTAGIVVSLYFVFSMDELSAGAFLVGGTLGQTLFIAGFTIFDFGFIVFASSWAEGFKADFASFIGFNRMVLYLSMALGLALGFILESLLAPVIPNLLIAIVGGVIVLLSVITLPCFDKSIPDDKTATAHSKHPNADRNALNRREEGMTDEQWRIEQIADACHLSKREREVFAYLARGMNAQMIQQELWISIHTVKTHMSNVYHKLGVHSAQELADMVEHYGTQDDRLVNEEERQ